MKLKRMRQVLGYRHVRELALLIDEALIKLFLRATDIPALDSKRSHQLDGQLVVSLTSYPERFNVLPWTLHSLLRQTVKPDRLILWIAESDFEQLTSEVLRLQEFGVDIMKCQDLRSYKKIIPTLQLFPDAYIVTADDDLFYPRDWLQQLVRSCVNGAGDAIAHRVHKIALDKEGYPKEYTEWQHCSCEPGASSLNFPTSGAGVLYSPGSFHSDVTRTDIFQKLCPDADDIWLYWMIRMRGRMAYNLKSDFRLRTWKAVRDANSLFKQNYFLGRNDEQIRALINCYGFPFTDAR